MTDIVDRLRNQREVTSTYSGTGTISLVRQANVDPLCREAADEIEALRAEVERLTACLTYEQHRSDRIGTHGLECWKWGPAHYECALVEVEALRKALEPFVKYNSSEPVITLVVSTDAITFAREVLANETAANSSATT